VSVAQRSPKDRPVLQVADHAVEAAIALQRDVLRVLIADGAEAAIEIAILNARTTQSTRGVSVRGHVWHCSIQRAAALSAGFAPHENSWLPI
jgi:hypothetical protein